MSGNDLAFVRQTMQLLHDRGITTWLFGGWAEELLGLAPPWPHHDLDLLYPADDFTAVDALLAASQDLTEIPAKRLPHKRAFVRLDIMTELILRHYRADHYHIHPTRVQHHPGSPGDRPDQTFGQTR